MADALPEQHQREQGHWADLREAGTLLGMRFMFFIHRNFGRRIFSIVLAPAMAYFALARPIARESSARYLQRHHSFYPTVWKSKPGLRQVITHFFAFGQSILDKILAWSKDIEESEFEIANPEGLERLMSDTRGQLIIGSHFGNLEYCRGFVHRYKGREINILVHDRHSANFVSLMSNVNPESRVNVFQVSELDVATFLRVKERVDRGEWLFIAGDRIPLTGDTRTVDASFLGENARWPVGPYLLAHALKCPVKLMFSYRTATGVRFDLEDFADRVNVERRNRDASLQQYAQKFASTLERQLEFAPYQWFNFFPFWQSDTEALRRDS